MSEIIKVDLPWPDRALSPNARMHRKALIEHRQAAREAGYFAAVEKDRMTNPLPPFEAEFIFFPPDMRRRDLDNLLAAEKHYLDGVCRAVGIDDGYITSIRLQLAWVEKGGKVMLLLKEAK